MPGSRNGPLLFIRASMVAAGLLGCATTVLAQAFSREQDIVDLRLGQRVLVDDGSCPAGQIKEVMGSQMTDTGVLRTRKCIQRLGTKKR